MSKQIEIRGLDLHDIKGSVSVLAFHLPLLVFVAMMCLWFGAHNMVLVGGPLWWVCAAWSGLLVLFNLPEFVRHNVIGKPIYFWLNGNTLEIRKQEWWVVEYGCSPVPNSAVMKIWFGGWFRRDMIFRTSSSWKVCMTWTFIFGRPKSLWLQDFVGDVISVGHLFSVKKAGQRKYCFWNTRFIVDVLGILNKCSSVSDALSSAAAESDSVAVAGKVNTG